MLSQQRLCKLLFVCCLFMSTACDNSTKNAAQQNNQNAEPPPGYGDGYGIDYNNIAFLDAPETNNTPAIGIADLTFVDLEGNSVKVKDLCKEKNIVLVITRGYTGPICPYCSTQISRLIFNYDKFSKRNAEVVVVYPIEHQKDASHWDAFMTSTREKLKETDVKVPFPILLDVELKSVVQLGIRKDLSKPATYILNKKGQVQFAYIGSTFADRPSIKAMLAQLDQLQETAKQPKQTNTKQPVKSNVEKKD